MNGRSRSLSLRLGTAALAGCIALGGVMPVFADTVTAGTYAVAGASTGTAAGPGADAAEAQDAEDASADV